MGIVIPGLKPGASTTGLFTAQRTSEFADDALQGQGHPRYQPVTGVLAMLNAAIVDLPKLFLTS